MGNTHLGKHKISPSKPSRTVFITVWYAISLPMAWPIDALVIGFSAVPRFHHPSSRMRFAARKSAALFL